MITVLTVVIGLHMLCLKDLTKSLWVANLFTDRRAGFSSPAHTMIAMHNNRQKIENFAELPAKEEDGMEGGIRPLYCRAPELSRLG
jgi:hypothetical protein